MPTLISPVELISRALECDASTLGADAGLGRHANWDSMGHLQIMMMLEEYYGVEITDETIRRYETLSAIVQRYEALKVGQL